MVAHKLPARCAICITGTVGLRPRQIDEGGPVFIICEVCDERPASGPPKTEIPVGRRRRFAPEVLAILVTVEKFDWISCYDIADVLNVPSFLENPKSRNTFSARLCRLHRKGYLERRQIPRWKISYRYGKGNMACEYNLTERGAAALKASRG